MKINIWKLLLAALVVPAAMGACTDERNNFMVDDSVSFVDSDGDWQEFKTLPVYDEAYRFPVVKNGKGLSGATIYIETPTISSTERISWLFLRNVMIFPRTNYGFRKRKSASLSI